MFEIQQKLKDEIEDRRRLPSVITEAAQIIKNLSNVNPNGSATEMMRTLSARSAQDERTAPRSEVSGALEAVRNFK